MSVTIASINTAIATALRAAVTVETVQDLDELSEGISEFPLIQVYWEEGETDTASENTQTTFGGPNLVRQTELVYHIDIFAAQRSFLGENMAKVIQITDEIWDLLDAEDTEPYFGVAGVKSLRYKAQRFQVEYGNKLYMGTQFVLKVRVF